MHTIILIIIILVLLIGGGGYFYQPERGPLWGGGLGVALVVILILYLAGYIR